MRLKDLLDQEQGIGELQLESFLNAAINRRYDQQAFRSESESDLTSLGESDIDTEASSMEDKLESDEASHFSAVPPGLPLDQHLVTEVMKMLMMLNCGLQVQHCKCQPGGPHTCMSPVASILSSQIQSLQHSLAQSVSQSLTQTRLQSRRASTERWNRHSNEYPIAVVPPDVLQKETPVANVLDTRVAVGLPMTTTVGTSDRKSRNRGTHLLGVAKDMTDADAGAGPSSKLST